MSVGGVLPNRGGNEGSSLIIVDNDAVLLNMVKKGLASEGYRCETTTSPAGALELIAETPFDILVSDIVMPGMDGFELTEKAKKLRPEITVIIMTGFIDDFSYDRAVEAGASDFIKKPFTLKEMKMKLRQVALQESLREMSVRDELTGLCNRNGYSVLAAQQIKLAGRYKAGIFALYAVLDNFSAISDTFGPKEAERALIDTANILKASYRGADIIARTAKNEFMVVPAGFSGDDIGMISDSLEGNLAEYNAKKSKSRRLSILFGITYYDPETPCSPEELLARGKESMLGRRKLAETS